MKHPLTTLQSAPLLRRHRFRRRSTSNRQNPASSSNIRSVSGEVTRTPGMASELDVPCNLSSLWTICRLHPTDITIFIPKSHVNAMSSIMEKNFWLSLIKSPDKKDCWGVYLYIYEMEHIGNTDERQRNVNDHNSNAPGMWYTIVECRWFTI